MSSIEPHKKNREIHRPTKKKKLALFIMRMAPKIIQFARLFSQTSRRRNAHQALLFPNSVKPFNDVVIEEANRSLLQQYKQKYPNWYPFYFCDGQTFVDNHHLQIFKTLPSLPFSRIGQIVCFGQILKSDAENLEKDKGENIKCPLFLGTQKKKILILDKQRNSFSSFQLPEAPIKFLRVYRHRILVCTQQTCYFLNYSLTKSIAEENGQKTLKYEYKINQEFMVKVLKHPSQFFTEVSFIFINETFYLFYTTEFGLFCAEIRDEFLSNVKNTCLIASSPAGNPFTNLRILNQKELDRVIVVACCTQYILIFSHHCSDFKTSLLYKMLNPKNPPLLPKSHTPNCVQFFHQQVKSQDEHQSHVLIAISFTERIYFIRLWNDYCEVSKRAKFYNRIIKIIPFRNESMILIFQKDSASMQHVPILVMLVAIKSIISFNFDPIHTETIDKIEFAFNVKKQLDSRKRAQISFQILGNNQILVLAEDEINRICIRTWKDIYIAMQESEGLQLLYFLILLKKCQSPYFLPPDNFEGLEKFIMPFIDSEHCGNVIKQTVLEYYYEMKMEPPFEFEAEIQSNYPELLLPFIFQHKITNLSDHCKELLVEYWKVKDERIVEELIIGGVEEGWELAVRRGWMRALNKIVEMGVEVHFPLLKLSSFIISEVESLMAMDRKYEIDENSYDEDEYNNQLEQIENYCSQFIEYALFALQNFMKPEEIGNLDDLKEFILTVFREHILFNCIRYCPEESVKLVSALFASPSLNSLLDHLNIADFIEFDRNFSSLVRTNLLSVCETLLSHLSEVFREITSNRKFYSADSRAKYRQLLCKQHAKLLNFDMHMNETQCRFQFLRGYIFEILVTLVSHNNSLMKEILWEEKKSLQESEMECYIQDYLAFIWNELKKSRSKDEQGEGEIIAPTVSNFKEYMGYLEQANSSNSYLFVQILSSLPNTSTENYSPKILRRYLQSSSRVIQSRVFEWLMVAMRDDENKKHLSKQLMNHLQTLIEINKEKSRMVFDEFFRNQEKEIIKRISNAPLLQLEYLEMIIEEYNEVIEEYYLNLHLNLLLRHDPQRVVTVLEEAMAKKVKYNLHEALKISLELEYSDKHRVETYLYEKLGDVDRCIRSYLKILEDLLWEYADLYESTSELSEEKEKKAGRASQDEQYEFTPQRKQTHKLSLIINGLMQSNKILSHNQTKLMEMEEEISDVFDELTALIFRQPIKKYEYLSDPLNSLVHFGEQVRLQKLREKEHYHKILGFYLGKMIIQSFEKGYLTYFVYWLKKQVRIGLLSIKRHLIQGYAKVVSQAILLQNMSTIDSNVLVQNIHTVLATLQKCVFSQNKCPICEFQFYDNEEALLFNCGHLFHKQCIEEDENEQDFCWHCIWRDPIKAMVDHPEANLVSILNKHCMKKSIRREVGNEKVKKQRIVTLAQKRYNRLGIFDKKVTSLRDQAQILDIKLEIQDFYRQSQLNQNN